MRVLFVEASAPLAKSLTWDLNGAGYVVDIAADETTAITAAGMHDYDIVLIDLTPTPSEGLALLSRFRHQCKAPVLLLTSSASVHDRVEGLDRGADDCLIKPFDGSELLARMRALVRRKYGALTNVIRVADLEIDLAARTVRRGGLSITLSAREYSVLEYLALRRGQVVARAEIWEHIYDFASEASSNVIDVYVGYLRKKIDQDHPHKLIHTRRGLGYLLDT